MITKELHDQGATCKGKGFNCGGCHTKGGCVDYVPTPLFTTRIKAKPVSHNLELRSERYIDQDNSLIKEDLRAEFFEIDEVIFFIQQNNINFDTERFYYGDYILKIDVEMILNDIENVRKYIEDYIRRVTEFETKQAVNIRGIAHGANISSKFNCR